MRLICGAVTQAINQLITLIFLLLVGRVVYELAIKPHLTTVLMLAGAVVLGFLAYACYRVAAKKHQQAEHLLQMEASRRAGREALRQYLLPGWELPPEGLPRKVGGSASN